MEEGCCSRKDGFLLGFQDMRMMFPIVPSPVRRIVVICILVGVRCDLKATTQQSSTTTTVVRARDIIESMTGSPSVESRSSMEERRVLVTGGNGFIGSWIVRTLLARGYAVTATYQPGTDAAHLLGLDLDAAARGRILLLPADLLDAGAISAAAAAGGGCRAGVLHVASPCTLADPRDPQAELVEPAVRGTLHVLEAARRAGARRVVVTSSISAMVPNPGLAGELVDERSWTDIEFCKARGKWYPVSKTLAERAAWEYAARWPGVLEVATILPSTCLGPLLQPTLNASSAVLQRLLQGSPDDQADYWLGAVHVRDVAAAHLLLLEAPTGTLSGRYLCTNGIYQFSDFARLAASLCPMYAHAIHRFHDTQPWLVRRDGRDAASRLLDLGLTLTPLEEAVKDAEKSLTDKGFLP